MSEEELRRQALERIRNKREFQGHLLMYVLVNLMLVGIWAFTGAGFFWPIFPMLGWGIGVVAHGWNTYRDKARITEEQIETEMRRRRGA